MAVADRLCKWLHLAELIKDRKPLFFLLPFVSLKAPVSLTWYHVLQQGAQSSWYEISLGNPECRALLVLSPSPGTVPAM